MSTSTSINMEACFHQCDEKNPVSYCDKLSKNKDLVAQINDFVSHNNDFFFLEMTY